MLLINYLIRYYFRYLSTSKVIWGCIMRANAILYDRYNQVVFLIIAIFPSGVPLLAQTSTATNHL